ncbi:MAG: hypothetical protein ACLQLC_18895 [Candidatus Sulfotelmatobacter sp.]
MLRGSSRSSSDKSSLLQNNNHSGSSGSIGQTVRQAGQTITAALPTYTGTMPVVVNALINPAVTLTGARAAAVGGTSFTVTAEGHKYSRPRATWAAFL